MTRYDPTDSGVTSDTPMTPIAQRGAEVARSMGLRPVLPEEEATIAAGAAALSSVLGLRPTTAAEEADILAAAEASHTPVLDEGRDALRDVAETSVAQRRHYQRLPYAVGDASYGPDEATVREWARRLQVAETRLEELRVVTSRRMARLRRAMDAFEARLADALLLDAALHHPDALSNAEAYTAKYMGSNAEVVSLAAEDMALTAALQLADTLMVQGLMPAPSTTGDEPDKDDDPVGA